MAKKRTALTTKIFNPEVGKVLLLAVLTFFVYSNSIGGEFIFDDSRIYLNPHIRLTTLDFKSLAEAWLESDPWTRPVVNTSFALNYYFHQYEVAGYHLVNIVIHAITGILLFLLAKITLTLPSMRSNGSSAVVWIPFVVALIWLLHPVQTQSVSYVIQRMNSMAGMFYLMSLYLYVRGRLSEGRKVKISFFLAAVAAGLLALGSKEIAITLPFFIFLYDWYFLRDLGLDRIKVNGVLVGAAFILVVFLTSIFFFGKDPFAGLLELYATRDFTLPERLLTELRVVVFYLSLLFYPFFGRLNLNHDFIVSKGLFDPLATVFSLLLLVFLFVYAIRSARRQRLLSFGILWFLGNLAIESTIVPLELTYEHRLYLPSAMLVFALVEIADRRLKVVSFKLPLLFLLMIFLSFGTYQRNKVWADRTSLWSDCVKKSPLMSRPHLNLAVALKKSGQLQRAEYHCREALRLDPTSPEAFNNLGNIQMLRGLINEAIESYSIGLQISPQIALLHNNIGEALMRAWRLKDAEFHFRKAVNLNPGDERASLNYSRVRRMLEYKKKTSGAKPDNF